MALSGDGSTLVVTGTLQLRVQPSQVQSVCVRSPQLPCSSQHSHPNASLLLIRTTHKFADGDRWERGDDMTFRLPSEFLMQVVGTSSDGQIIANQFYVRNVAAGVTIDLSAAPYPCGVSPDGSKLLVQTLTNSSAITYVATLNAQRTAVASYFRLPDSALCRLGEAFYSNKPFSSDNRYVLFSSFSELSGNDTISGREDVYLFDIVANATVDVLSTYQADSWTFGSFSPDNRLVVLSNNGESVQNIYIYNVTSRVGPSLIVSDYVRRFAPKDICTRQTLLCFGRCFAHRFALTCLFLCSHCGWQVPLLHARGRYCSLQS